jgi:ABC-type transporter Mla MlaB component
MEPSSLRVRLRLLRAGAVHLAVAGEVDVAVADDLAEVSRLVRSCSPTAVELDLGGVTFVDLHGLRSLDDLVRDQEAQGIAVHERRTPPCVRRLRSLLAAARARASHVSGARSVDVA